MNRTISKKKAMANHTHTKKHPKQNQQRKNNIIKRKMSKE